MSRLPERKQKTKVTTWSDTDSDISHASAETPVGPSNRAAGELATSSVADSSSPTRVPSPAYPKLTIAALKKHDLAMAKVEEPKHDLPSWTVESPERVKRPASDKCPDAPQAKKPRTPRQTSDEFKRNLLGNL